MNLKRVIRGIKAFWLGFIFVPFVMIYIIIEDFLKKR